MPQVARVAEVEPLPLPPPVDRSLFQDHHEHVRSLVASRFKISFCPKLNCWVGGEKALPTCVTSHVRICS
eukprot:2741431-Amphidinium_carterae.1